MALARLAADHQRSGAAEIAAFTVDHGLRPESADEAAKVAKWCKAAGLKHQILKWTGEKPTSGIQEAARNARYRLLCNAVLENNCSAILTAHTSDDQAETVFMRLTRGAGTARSCCDGACFNDRKWRRGAFDANTPIPRRCAEHFKGDFEKFRSGSCQRSR